MFHSSGRKEQSAKLAELSRDLKTAHKVDLDIDYSETLHDREIRQVGEKIHLHHSRMQNHHCTLALG